ncbi:MAG: DEAD/DEAH box helicase [Lentisphaeria bacterium]|nr:DEAD/DEAH box helicase [Lentisphaeria bacterium]
MSFDKLGLNKDILAGVTAKGYTIPTPIQRDAIPVVLAGKDILAGAQTGTGKTAAFTLPLLHLLSTRVRNRPSNAPRALVLAPTRELAAQVAESVAEYGQGLDLISTVIFGGVGIGPQKQRLKRGVDIVIGTPGRLLDLVNQRALDLSKIEVLILDEADRMLDMGFIHDIRKIIKIVPKQRQTLFFSATYSKDIKILADTILTNPVLVEVARQNTAAESVDQFIYHVEKDQKRNLVIKLIQDGDWSQVLVFTKTKHGANRLAKYMDKAGITAAAIHGNKSQSARTKALKSFKAKEIQVLVATDIAARGIDIDQLPHVVNYELPHVSEDYVHRIGRTGRAGCSGEAISLVEPEERKLLKGIERLIKKKIEVKVSEGFSIDPNSKFTPRPKPDTSNRRQGNNRGRSNDNRSSDNRRSDDNRSSDNRRSNDGRSTDNRRSGSSQRRRSEESAGNSNNRRSNSNGPREQRDGNQGSRNQRSSSRNSSRRSSNNRGE